MNKAITFAQAAQQYSELAPALRQIAAYLTGMQDHVAAGGELGRRLQEEAMQHCCILVGEQGPVHIGHTALCELLVDSGVEHNLGHFECYRRGGFGLLCTRLGCDVAALVWAPTWSLEELLPAPQEL